VLTHTPPPSRFRIVTDNYRGYEVQEWHHGILFSRWKQVGSAGRSTNTHYSIDEAESFAREHAQKPPGTPSGFVKYVDIPPK
jgi:hypothetical protein